MSTGRRVPWRWPWAPAPKEAEPEDPADHYLKDLQRSGKVATAALAVVTAVLGVFGIREGIPQRILRDQPVATLISFMLIGSAILLAGLSIFSFDKNHPKLETPSSSESSESDSLRKLLNAVLSKRWLLVICTFSVIFLVVWAAFIVGSWLEEISYTLGRQLVLALVAALLGTVALIAVWSVDGTTQANKDTKTEGTKAVAENVQSPGTAQTKTTAAGIPERNDEKAKAKEAARRTLRMLIISVLYFAMGLLLVAQLVITSPGLTRRPRIAVSLDGRVLNATIKGEDLSANRTYAIVVKLIPRSTDGTGTAGSHHEVLQRLQTGADEAGKVDVTVKTALPAGRGGKVLVVAAPSERVLPDAAAGQPAQSERSSIPWVNDWFGVKPTVDLGLRDCPDGNSVIACASMTHRPRPATQLTDVTLATGPADKPHNLKFKVSAHNLKVDQQVEVAVTVARKKRVTIYDGIFSGEESGAFDTQHLSVEVPPRARRVCINARVVSEPTDIRRAAVCPAARSNVGAVSVWLRVSHY